MKIAYTIKDAATAASVSEQTIVLAIESGMLIARRLNDQAHIFRADMEAWGESLPDYLLTSGVTPQPILRLDVA